MASIARGMTLTQACLRRFSQTAARRSATQEVASSKFAAVKEYQKTMQIEDGVPVHLKAGIKDKLMYYVTVGMLSIGLGMSVEVLYKITFKDS